VREVLESECEKLAASSSFDSRFRSFGDGAALGFRAICFCLGGIIRDNLRNGRRNGDSLRGEG